MQVCTLGSDEGQVKDELDRLAQAFSTGSAAESPPLPLSSLVIQVIVIPDPKLIFCMIILFQSLCCIINLLFDINLNINLCDIFCRIILEYRMLRHLMPL